MLNICIYEDIEFEQFFPFTLTKPVYDLRIGIMSPFEKILARFGFTSITLHIRNHLKPLMKIYHSGFTINHINTGSTCLFINGRVLVDDKLAQILINADEKYDWLFLSQGQVVATILSEQNLEQMKKFLEKSPSNSEIISNFRSKCMCYELESVNILTNIYDLLSLKDISIEDDFKYINQAGIIKGQVNSFTSIQNEHNIFIDKKSKIEDFVFLNAEKGPIYIEKNVHIEAHSRLEGPLFIGENSRINGGRISHSSIGKNCKIAGEVSNSTFLDYSNKAHQGFIGHSYIGNWVNLGAMTTNSNLKNTYGDINLQTDKGILNTQKQFLGAMIGDHTKTAIGTLLNTGSIIGYGSVLLGSEIHDKYVPHFSWGYAGKYEAIKINKFLEIATKMMARRNKELTSIEKEIIVNNFNSLSRPNLTYSNS